MKQLTILVDMDDCIEDLSVAWVDYLNTMYGTTVAHSELKEWDMTKAFPELTAQQVYGVLEDPALWANVSPLPGAVKYVRKLIEDGNQVFICTASQPNTIATKLSLVLFRYFPYLRPEDVIVANRKQMIKGDILIDDGFHNFGGQPMGFLFTANHNKSITDEELSKVNAVRVNNWKEAYDLIHNFQTHFKTGGIQ